MLAAKAALNFDAAEIEHLILTLGAIGAHSGTGVWRRVYDPEWVAAQALLADWMGQAGLATRMDAVGNLWGRVEGSEGGKAVVSGSHIDSQCPGGRYDGALGVIAALVAIRALIATYGPPKRPLEVLSLCEEEGSRFPTAGFWGSRAITGRIAEGDADHVLDEKGGSIAAAMASIGLDPELIPHARRNDLASFIELHIEQGPVLEHADCSVAVVSAITGIRHTKITVTGEQNHAGAFPMDLRRDPMAGFAEMAGGLIDHAHRLGRPAVTTIGRIEVWPNAPAIIPRDVTFTLDARHPRQADYANLHQTHGLMLREIAERRGLTLSSEVQFDLPPMPCDPAIIAALTQSAQDLSIPHVAMASGAGHDSQQIAVICPVGMVFVRSKDGRSHTPEEFSSLPDIIDGVRVLAEALFRLAY
jgi:allantoate deiminase